MPRTVDPRIVILDIDEKSLAEKEKGGEGRWPWPRDRLALLLDKLFDQYEIAIVGFDVVFAERDESSGIRVLERLGERELRDVPQFQSVLTQIKPQLEYDDIFARKMKGRAVVLGYTFSGDGSRRRAEEGHAAPAGLHGGDVRRAAGRSGPPPGTATRPTSRCCRRTPRARPFQLAHRRRRHHPPRADAGRVQRRLLRAVVAGDGARAARLAAGDSRSSPDQALAPEGYPDLEWLQVGLAQDPGGRQGERAGALPRAQGQLQVLLDRGRAERPRRPGRTEGQDRAGRHDRARACSTCGRPRSTRSIRASRCTPT